MYDDDWYVIGTPQWRAWRERQRLEREELLRPKPLWSSFLLYGFIIAVILVGIVGAVSGLQAVKP